MNIAIDIDDTISETFETLLPYAVKYTTEELKKDPKIEITGEYKTHFYIVEICKWNKIEAMKFWMKYYAQILREVNPKKFAPEVINNLRDRGHKIYLITARWSLKKDDTKLITEKCLKENKK